MNAEEFARTHLASWTVELKRSEPDHTDCVIRAEHLKLAVQAVMDWGYLITLTGLDYGTDGLEVLYHFGRQDAVLTLRVRYTIPLLPSITDLIPYARIHEQEIWEMFGICFDQPYTHLLLPDDWIEGIYPLRKGVMDEGKVYDSHRTPTSGA